MELNFFAFGMKIYFNLSFQGNENIEFFSQEAYDFQILGNETMVNAGYEDTNFFISWL